MPQTERDKPITKKELGSWARVVATVVPILVAVITATWALSGQAKDAETQFRSLKEVQDKNTLLLKQHADILNRVPRLEQSLGDLDKALDRVTDQLEKHQRWTQRLNDVLIRVETKLEGR